MLYLQSTFCSMLLFYRCTVHKSFGDDVGNLDTEICIVNSWRAAPAFSLTHAFILHLCTWNKHNHSGLSYNCSAFLLLVLKKKLEVVPLQRVILVIWGFFYYTSVPTVLYGLWLILCAGLNEGCRTLVWRNCLLWHC